MRVEIRDMLSMGLIPENDSDRAILASWSKIDVIAHDIRIHSHTWGDGKIEKMVLGFVTKPIPIPR